MACPQPFSVGVSRTFAWQSCGLHPVCSYSYIAWICLLFFRVCSCCSDPALVKRRCECQLFLHLTSLVIIHVTCSLPMLLHDSGQWFVPQYDGVSCACDGGELYPQSPTEGSSCAYRNPPLHQQSNRQLSCFNMRCSHEFLTTTVTITWNS